MDSEQNVQNRTGSTNPVDQDAFGRRLQYCAEKVGSFSALAKATGIRPASFSDYLSGKSDPPRQKIIAIAEAVGVSAGWLTTGEGAPDGTPQPPAPEKRPGETLSNSLPERLRFALRKLGSLKELAQKSGVAHADIQSYINGKEASTKHLTAIADAARLDINWLLTGKGSLERIEYMNATPGKHLLDEDDDNGNVPVPLISVTASAGHGAVALDERVEDHISFSSKLLRNLGIQPREAFILPALGDSMEPRIRSGELMLCSRSPRHLKGADGTYIVRLEGEVLVKRIQRIPGGKVRVSSENTGYSPFEVALSDGVDFTILGLVMWVFRRV